jgi:hypothetical protein
LLEEKGNFFGQRGELLHACFCMNNKERRGKNITRVVARRMDELLISFGVEY